MNTQCFFYQLHLSKVGETSLQKWREVGIGELLLRLRVAMKISQQVVHRSSVINRGNFWKNLQKIVRIVIAVVSKPTLMLLGDQLSN